MLRRFVLFVFLSLIAIPLFAAGAQPAGDDSPKAGAFPHASHFQERHAIPAKTIRALCADCEIFEPIDLTPGGFPSNGCNDLHQCTLKGCTFNVYAHCFLGPEVHPEWGIWSPCTAC